MKRVLLPLALTLVFFASLFGLFFASPPGKWIDESHQAFMPAEVDKKLSAYRDFPIFWWNFLVFEDANGHEMDSTRLSEICRALAQKNGERIKMLPCTTDLTQVRPTLDAWIEDLPRRQKMPNVDELAKRMDETLAKASFPLGREIIDILRRDPFDQVRALQVMAQEKANLSFEKRNGYFFDPATGRTLAPIQFSFPPTNTVATGQFLSTLKETAHATLVGAHASTHENETRVKQDIHVVSSVGMILLGLLCGGLLLTGRWKLLLLLPPLFLCTGAAVLLTILVFGSIHGLALAFGPGIIGLAMDFGIHASFAAKTRRLTWAANSIGLLTTLTVMGVGVFSRLPVLKQLMFFSGTGLVLSFFAFYFLQRLFPSLYEVKPFALRRLTRKSLGVAVLLLAAVAIYGLTTLKPNYSMSEINYETYDTGRLTRWLFTKGGLQPPYLQVYGSDSASSLQESEAQKSWARDHGVRLETIANLLPGADIQAANLRSWEDAFCQKADQGPGERQKAFRLTDTQKAFFAPYFERFDCQKLRPNLLSPEDSSPAYLSDFQHGSSWVTLWMPSTADQIAAVKSQFKDVESVGEIVAHFPEILASELSWMVPATFTLSLLLMVVYYRRLLPAVVGMLPFFTGLGAFFFASLFIDLKVSFITLIGFIMVFGFSLDYGIFAAKVPDDDSVPAAEVRSSLTLSTLTTLAGFLPLIFAHHPALTHLGQALILGTLGTHFGAIWGVPIVLPQGGWGDRDPEMEKR